MGRRLESGLLGAAAALAACTTDFPGWRGDGDGGPFAEDAAPFDGAPDVAFVTRRDFGLPDGAPVRPDAAPPPPDLGPDAAPPPPSLTFASEDAAPPGCAPRDVRLAWETTSLTSCRLASHPPGTDLEVPPDGAHTVNVAADTQFVLTCHGPDGPLSSSVSIAFVPGLAATRAFANRDEVRAEQRRCAAVRGHEALAEEAHVHHDGESARQVCRCAGYGGVAALSDGGSRCFASPGDNRLAYWREAEDRWDVRRATDDNRCLQQLTCATPAARCAELYAP
jgi:hypothetical protein